MVDTNKDTEGQLQDLIAETEELKTALQWKTEIINDLRTDIQELQYEVEMLKNKVDELQRSG